MIFKKNSIFGILNVTPDSFSDGGRFFSPEKAIARALEMVEEGADFIDVGGESSRPFSSPVTVEEEMKRVIPVIEGIRASCSAGISVDTCKWQVAEAAMKAGACIINDIKGFSDPKMVEIAARFSAAVIVMHMKGTPSDMQSSPHYVNLEAEIMEFFSLAVKKLESAGVSDIILDPGIGFGKTPQHNLRLIKNIGFFKTLGKPLMLGVSRKSFIGFYSGEKDPLKRLPGTLAANIMGMLSGADLFRVHDVKECLQAFKIAEEIISAEAVSK